MSNTKRLTSEMIIFESESCKIITPATLYVVKISIDNILTFEEIKKLAIDELYSEPQPSAIYFSSTEIILVFSYVVENYYLPGGYESFQHQLDGNQHLLISKYATKFARSLPTSKISVRIVEFETQTQVIAYLGWIVFQVSQATLIKLSKGKINEDLIQFRTQSELKDILFSSTSVSWDDVSKHDKYGTFIKLKRRKNKLTVSEMSEIFDARENKKYTRFIFGQ